jgi:autotransporter-associated beta strand protein
VGKEQPEDETAAVDSRRTITLRGAERGTTIRPAHEVERLLPLLFIEARLRLVSNNLTFRGFTLPEDLPGAVFCSERDFEIQSAGRTIFAENSARGGAAVCCFGRLTLSGDGPMSFQYNHGREAGGAVMACSVTITASNVAFRDNTALEKGGAICIRRGLGETTFSTLVNFIGNIVTGENSKGGAIFTDENLTVVDAWFDRNSARSTGGAVHMQGLSNLKSFIIGNNTFRYGVNRGRVINIDAEVYPAQVGDNDFSCGRNCTFVKDGEGTLVLGTHNADWQGNLRVLAGSLIIGGDNRRNDAVWGSLAQPGLIRVSPGATLGGAGTIYARNVVFSPGSVWQLGVGETMTGCLLVRGTLTLPATVQLSYPLAAAFPAAGCTVATYGSLAGASLGIINGGLADYHLVALRDPNRLVLRPGPSPVDENAPVELHPAGPSIFECLLG